MRPTRPLLLTALLCGCSGEASHLGNPLTWPAQAVQSAVSNGVCDARRAKVQGFVAANHAAILD